MEDPIPAPPKTGTQSFFESLRSFHRSKTDCQIGGVCGGLGECTPLPAWVYRVVFLLLLISFGVGPVLYIILWACVPEAEDVQPEQE